MAVSAAPPFALERTFADELGELAVDWQASPAPQPRLLTLNEPLARELGFEPEALRSADGVAFLLGAHLPDDARPVAQAYAGHQFGGWSGRLGDGRALLLGEVVDRHGRRRDLHLKGSGRTPFARGAADGKAAVGPMLREHVIGEALHALGIPTSRALAVLGTGEGVRRETILPGAVLVRVAASHLRVGTFELVAAAGDPALLRRLADYAIARHHPQAADAERPALALLDAVVDAQARLVAQWRLVGFVHGVLNTDNTTISGESLDFGPCAFMEAYDPATVYSSIDHGGRYAFANQPLAVQWNLARLAEALLPLVDEDRERAIALANGPVQAFAQRHEDAWQAGLHRKLGLDGAPRDGALADDLLVLLHEHRVDWTSAFRRLARTARGEDDELGPAFDGWRARWLAEIDAAARSRAEAADAMDAVNPAYVPRNAVVEEALARATAGDLAAVEELLEVVTRPFDERPGLERFAEPGPADDGPYVTFCGT